MTLGFIMRFVIHTPYYPPEMGAPQARLSSLAQWLAGRGHDVWVLTAMPNYPLGRIFPGYSGLLRREKRDGVSIVRTYIYPTSGKNVFRRILNYLSFLVSSLIAGVLFLPRADYILTETPPPFLGLAGWLLAKMKGSRWIFNVSDLWVESMRDFGFIGKGWAYLALRSMVRFFCKRAWLVTGQSREVIAEIRSQAPSARVYHLSNGADPHFFGPEKRDEEIRGRYLKPGETGFVYAGLHGFFQGLDQVVNIAGRFEQDHFRFLFFGEGPEKEHLVRLARELNISNVDFHPAVPHHEVPPILASLDVAVVPLKKEIRGSVPSKIYEAMSSGVPVLLVGNGEAGKIIRDAEAGIAVTPGNREDLERSISEIAGDPARRRRMGEGGRNAVEKLYSRREIARRFEAILLGQEKGETRGGEVVRDIQTNLAIHRAEGRNLWASRGCRIWGSADGGETWRIDGVLPTSRWRRPIDDFSFTRRLSRGGVFGVAPQVDGATVCVGRKMIFRAEKNSGEFKPVFPIPRGSRPLNLCQTPQGEIYWGEYFLNLRRSAPVNVFGSRDGGRTWAVVHTFPRGSVCHIHRVAYDPFEDALLVCTGDRDSESGVWRTKDRFHTLEPLMRGTQECRTTALVALPEGLLYGTDFPAGQNYIMALDRETASARRIQAIPGPALYVTRVGEEVVFATMVEKRSHEVTLWAGSGNSFHLLAHFKTRKRSRLWREIGGYDTVILPEGRSHWPNLFCTPLGTSEHASFLLRIDLEKAGESRDRPLRTC